MRFLVFVRMTPESATPYEQGAMPADEDIAKMMAFNGKLVDSGSMLTGDGLYPTSQGAIVSFETGSAVITDGPFTEAKDVIGGYWTIKADSREAIVDLFTECPMSDGDVLEIREIFEMSDFEAAIAER